MEEQASKNCIDPLNSDGGAAAIGCGTFVASSDGSTSTASNGKSEVLRFVE